MQFLSQHWDSQPCGTARRLLNSRVSTSAAAINGLSGAASPRKFSLLPDAFFLFT
jgi:hypothetical protein